MRQKLIAHEKPFLLVVLTAVSCLTLLFSNYSATRGRNEQENRPHIINLTSGFEPSSLTEKDGAYVVLLKNNYSKNINGYVIGIGKSGRVSADLTVGSQAISPGDVAEERIPISNLRASAGGDAPQYSITILAVLFEDGTSEGAASAIAEIKERRAGTKIQLKRILSLIREKLNAPDAAKPSIIKQLKEQIAALSEETEETPSAHAKKGLRNAKDDALMSLQNLEQSDVDLQKGLIRLKSSIEKRIARL